MSSHAQAKPKANNRLVSDLERHVTLTFSLSLELIQAINKQCGQTRGARSQWAEGVLRQKLGLPSL